MLSRLRNDSTPGTGRTFLPSLGPGGSDLTTATDFFHRKTLQIGRELVIDVPVIILDIPFTVSPNDCCNVIGPIKFLFLYLNYFIFAMLLNSVGHPICSILISC